MRLIGHLTICFKRYASHFLKTSVLAPLLVLLFLFNAAQSKAQALRATGGTGIHRDKIYWLDFSGMADLAAGGSVTRTFTVNGIAVTVIVDQVAFSAGAPGTARIQAYRSGTWTGDGLDDVYNRNGTGTNNTLTNALITNTAGIEGTFRVRAYATLNGSPFDLSLIYANAEEDNLTFEQSRGTTNGSGWQLLEGVVQSGSATRQIIFSGGTNQTITMKMSSNNTTTPANVALMHTSLAATTLAAPLTVTFGIGPQFGTTGNGALALGIMLNQDMGDAPTSYGAAANFVAATITGGSNNPPPLGGTWTLSGTLSNITAGNVTEPASPKLGSNAGDIENDYPTSPVGLTDDATATDDEDAFLTNPSINVNAFAYTANFTAFKNTTTASTPVYIMAWIDANRDGIFGPLEYATTSFTANNSTQNISLPWNLTAMPKSAGSSYMRIRITTTDPSTLTDNTGTPADERSFAALNNGETEDYPLTLFQPVPCTSGIVYGIQSTSSNADSQRVMYRVDTTNGSLSNPINLFGGGSAATSSTQRTTALALDVSTNTVWFCDRTNPRIYSYDLNTGTWGTAVANFGNPAISGSQNINKAAYNIRDGNVYFHNVGDNNIYRFDPTNPNTAAVALGAITVTGATGYTGGDLAFDSLGNMLGAFTSANVVAVFPASYNSNGDYLGFSLTGQIVRTITANTPAGLAFLPSGNMLIGNSVGQTTAALSYLNTTTGVQTDIASGPPSGPFGFVDLASCSSPAPNLIVKKTATAICNAGTTNVTYTITVQNTGRYHAFNVTLIDALPAGLTLASATLNGSALTTTNLGTTGVLIHSPGGIAGSGHVLKGQTATIVLNCTAASTPANYSNQAFVTYTGVETLRLPNNRIPSDDPSTGTANDATVINNAGCGSITGTLFNDNDGTTGGVNGTSTGMNAVTVELLSADGNTVLATTTTNASGAYTFSNRSTGVTYIVRVTAPSGFSHVSSSDGITPTDGLTTVVLNANQSGISFGLNQPPTATPNNPVSQPNPGATNNVTIAATSFAGTDPNSGSIASMTIPTFPTNATSITINGTTYTSGTFPGGGVNIPTNAAGNPTQTITIDPAPGGVTVGISYTVTDAAGLSSAGGTLNVAFSGGAVVSGTVFNDNDGTTGNANGTNYTGGGLDVILISGTNTVLAVSAVSAVDGSYSLPDAGNGSYVVMLTTANPAIGSTAAATSTLPGTFANVSSSDGITPTDGRTSVTIASNASVTGVHFGINQPPTATPNNLVSQPNPGGTNNVTIAASSFAGTDPNSGSIASMTIPTFPTNATSITINGTTYTSGTFPGIGVNIPTNAAGNPTQTITIDPAPGGVTVGISYTVTDAAGLSSAGGTLNVAFSGGAVVSGTVFNDNNGTTGNANGTNYTSGGLNAILISGTNTVLAVSAVSAVDGSYSLPDAGNGSYIVMLTTANPAIGSTAAATSTLPGTFVNVSSSDGITPTDGRTSVTIASNASVTGVHFGINQPPTATPNNPVSQPNPGATNNVTIAATSFAGTDPNSGSIATMTIPTFPTNATSITINGTTYTSGTFPGVGVTIPTNAAGNPTQTITVDPAAGAVTVGIPYTVTDNAGLSSAGGTLNVAFSAGGSVSGTIFNDNNGTTGNANGANYTAGGLNVILISGTNTVLAVAAVSTVDGSYTLPDAENGSYVVMLTTANPVIGSTAPATSTLPGTFANVSSNDNITPTDGRTSVTISGGSPATGISFGINQAPTGTANNPASQPNPGGTNNATIPATSFAGTAANGGSIGFVRITSFPTNATSITINGTTYTSGTFPGGGVTVPTNASGNPTQTIAVDPIAGAVTVQVPFVIISGAGVASSAQTLDVVFTAGASVTGIIYNDNNGATGNANGAPYTAGGLNVIFINSGTVVAVSAVSTVDGTYSLPDVPNGNYTVMLSTANPVIGTAAPASSVLPGTYQNVSSSDNVTPTDGITSVTISGGSPVTGISFGISQPPTATSTNQTNQENPGGTTNVSILATNFSGSDPNGGSISTLTITGFPTNATSITIDGTTYTAGTFPVAGVVVPTNAAGNPTQAISIDPVDGLVTVQIPYTLQDAAGLSTPASTLDLVFSSALPITLETFTVATSGCKATMNWTVSNAINFSHFEIQSSADGSNYKSIASIPYTSGTPSYFYMPEDLTSGRHFFRLRLVDLDGTFEYSHTASVNINCDQQPIIAYPNPVHDVLTLRGLRAGDQVFIHSDLGQLLVSRRANDNKMEISLMPYSNGSYIVTIMKKTGELLVKKNIIKSTGR